MYFKVKSILQSDGAVCKISIVKSHGEKEGNFGPQFEYDILCDGQEMKWMMSENQKKKYKEVGESSFVIKRWDSGGRTGFNFVPEGDITVQPHNLPTVPAEPSVPVHKDEFAEKVSRGASWNNAVSYVCNAPSGEKPKTLDEFLLLVAKVAEQIAPHQKAFVNGSVAEVGPSNNEFYKDVKKATDEPDPVEPPQDHDSTDDILPF